jgi:hypothetical protein
MSYARIFLKFFIMNNTITPVRRVGGGCSRRKPPSHLDLLATVPVSERGRGPRRRCTGPAAARGETRKSADTTDFLLQHIHTRRPAARREGRLRPEASRRAAGAWPPRRSRDGVDSPCGGSVVIPLPGVYDRRGAPARRRGLPTALTRNSEARPQTVRTRTHGFDTDHSTPQKVSVSRTRILSPRLRLTLESPHWYWPPADTMRAGTHRQCAPQAQYR